MLPPVALRRPLAAAAAAACLSRARPQKNSSRPAGGKEPVKGKDADFSNLVLEGISLFPIVVTFFFSFANYVLASLATGPRQNDSIFYEIRTYDIKPSKMKEFVEMANKYFHLRTAHSELVGLWSAELGAMNKVVHIWKYDDFAHRTAVRQALASDKDWQGKFISPALSMIEKQHNEVAYLVPWCQLGKPPKEGGVYEWVTFQMKPGGPALWGEAFRAAINAHINTGYTKLIGVFHTEYGLLNTVHVMWWNESPDHRAAGRHRAHEDARVVAAVRDSVRFLESQQNMLLIPLQFSPLK